jgi:hypothetical protein
VVGSFYQIWNESFAHGVTSSPLFRHGR